MILYCSSVVETTEFEGVKKLRFLPWIVLISSLFFRILTYLKVPSELFSSSVICFKDFSFSMLFNSSCNIECLFWSTLC